MSERIDKDLVRGLDAIQRVTANRTELKRLRAENAELREVMDKLTGAVGEAVTTIFNPRFPFPEQYCCLNRLRSALNEIEAAEQAREDKK